MIIKMFLMILFLIVTAITLILTANKILEFKDRF